MTRTRYKLAAIVLVGLAAACGSEPEVDTLSPPTAPPATTAAATPEPASAEAGEKSNVTRVIDGDTFELSDGRTIRVLGIDSCESDTPGGEKATKAANRRLSGETVTLVQQTGVDQDRYGRLLRYVKVGTQDFGESMVPWDHTGIYEGGDASAEYMKKLYASDTERAENPPSGRECGGPNPKPEPVNEPAPEPEKQEVVVEEEESNCHPSYSPCIPDGPDLDCGDLSHSVTVKGSDPYRLDSDDDGRGCE